MAAQSKSVLIVDDNQLIRHSLCRLFAREDYFELFGEAQNGREAVEKAQEMQPDLIVMDLSMPIMNGLDAARQLQRLMPAVPIIMFSDYSNALTQEEARSAGIAALVSKAQPGTTLLSKARDLLYNADA